MARNQTARAVHGWLAHAGGPLAKTPPEPPLRKGGKGNEPVLLNFPPLRRGGSGGWIRIGPGACATQPWSALDPEADVGLVIDDVPRHLGRRQGMDWAAARGGPGEGRG